jgi:tetratricopeptide (TPR) repeat protein
MPLLMTWFQNTKRGHIAFVTGLIAVILLVAARGSAQDTLEQTYQQALDSFNNAKMEDACELFRQVEKEKPGYKQTKTYLKTSCDQVNRMIEMENDLFSEGVQFFNQGRFDDAKQKFDQASKIQLKNAKHRSEANRYIKEADSRLAEIRTLQEGIKLFDDGDYAAAQERFSQVAQGGGPKVEEARGYQKRIEEAVGRIFNEGVQRFKAGNYAGARSEFDRVAKMGGSRASEAGSYLQQISKLQSQAAVTPKPESAGKEPGPATSGADSGTNAGEQTLRAGLQAYFEGREDDAERFLSDYISNRGQKQALAYFFRGAAHSTRYFLSGEKDSPQKDLAKADFRAVRNQAGAFQPPEKLVPPKILSLYSEAIGPR